MPTNKQKTPEMRQTAPLTLKDLRSRSIPEGDSIANVLDDLAHASSPTHGTGRLLDGDSPGVAFVTFAYGIDGVSLEIAKYATCLQELVRARGGDLRIHCIGGNFAANAEQVLSPAWTRYQLANADGWAKWDEGKWFNQLFHEDIPEGGDRGHHLEREIWNQALELTSRLTLYLSKHDIDLLYIVNVNSNPGNLAFALALVLTSEITGCPVINNNHDFYWEGGSPQGDRQTGQNPGPRDHFYRNQDNRMFFSFFQRILPWNGQRWIQLNINVLQSQRLIDQFGFQPDRVRTIGTGIDDSFFRPCTAAQKQQHRVHMAHILSGGDPLVTPVPLQRFLEELGGWMNQQHPAMLSGGRTEPVDIASPDTIYLLQPTRVVGRKCIGRDWDLIAALLRDGPLRDAFDSRPDMTLTLHVTGPVPIEHRQDLTDVLTAYQAALDTLPPEISRRVFQAFSVGKQTHASLDCSSGLDVAALYHLSDAVLFPSLTEGRGLPIIESAAAGIPIVCRRYDPEPVFADVIGEHLPLAEQILFDEFPLGEFDPHLLSRIALLLLDPESISERVAHNRAAVRKRYSFDGMIGCFRLVLDALENSNNN